MNELKRRLSELKTQKEAIENEIASLEQQLNFHTKKELSKEEKIELFKSLFISNPTIFARKWVSQDGNKQNYFPVTQTFKGEDYLPLTNEMIEKHLRGLEELATYPITFNNSCTYVVLQLLQQDVVKVQKVLAYLNIEAAFECNANADIHAWIFFSTAIEAKRARALAEKILRQAHVGAKIYPTQEFLNASSLGDALPLPLHLKHRQQHKTIFLDVKTMKVLDHQWQYLQHIKRLSRIEIEHLTSEEEIKPKALEDLDVEFPTFALKLFLNDFIYINTKHLSKSFLNKLKSFAMFDNPQVQVLLRLRRPLYNTPRVIKSFEEEKSFLKLPRGLFQTLLEYFNQHGVSYEVDDRRFFEAHSFPPILYRLREEQEEAIEAILNYDCSICVAPPGFGKTLIGAAMIEKRACKTLIVVNKNMLLNQWIDRFKEYFGMAKKEIGYLGKGKNRLNGVLDVATMQSLKNAPEIIENYSFVIVDECHHIPAVTFEQIIKTFKGKYILGLSATPKRKDGLEPILFQQLGDVAYEFKPKKSFLNRVEVVRTAFQSNLDNYSNIITELCLNKERNLQIVQVIKAHKERSILVLTDRLEHISELEKLLDEHQVTYLSVHGNLSKKEQQENMDAVKSNQLILATTSFFGEGIDFPHLNTIIFATPISYYGRLIQYLGRIGRDGQECLAIDFLDSQNAMLNSAFSKRKEGYKQMHYKFTKGF